MKIHTRALVPLLLACAWPLAAQGGSPGNRWHPVLTAEDGTIVEIDTASVSLDGDSVISMRTAYRFSSPMTLPSGEQVDREIDHADLDCAGVRIRPTEADLYLGDTLMASTPGLRSWAAVAPERRPVFDATCAFLLGGFTTRLRGRPQTEVQPLLANREVVGRALQREYRVLQMIGTVNVKFRVREDGTVDERTVTVLAQTDEAFAEPALRVVNEMRFRPARVAGWPVSIWVTLPVTFRPDG